MSLVRPELRDAMMRHREGLAGLALVALGLWWASGTGLLPWIGWPIAAVGAALAYTGLQRARFRRVEDGPGIVKVTEGRVAYMGPLDGGTVDLAELETLVLDPVSRPPVWRLEAPGAALAVPVGAVGADTLFDAFARLPGLDTGRMLAELKRGEAEVVVWSRARERRLLH